MARYEDIERVPQVKSKLRAKKQLFSDIRTQVGSIADSSTINGSTFETYRKINEKSPY
jgi:hypothetical protein